MVCSRAIERSPATYQRSSNYVWENARKESHQRGGRTPKKHKGVVCFLWFHQLIFFRKIFRSSEKNCFFFLLCKKCQSFPPPIPKKGLKDNLLLSLSLYYMHVHTPLFTGSTSRQSPKVEFGRTPTKRHSPTLSLPRRVFFSFFLFSVCEPPKNELRFSCFSFLFVLPLSYAGHIPVFLFSFNRGRRRWGAPPERAAPHPRRPWAQHPRRGAPRARAWDRP